MSSKTGQEVTLPSVTDDYQPGDEPFPADYDGVGHAEAAVIATLGGVGTWYVAGHQSNVASFAAPPPIGLPTTLPMLGDFNGDGKIDPAIFDFYQWDNQAGDLQVTFQAESSFTTIVDTTVPLTYDPAQDVGAASRHRHRLGARPALRPVRVLAVLLLTDRRSSARISSPARGR